MRWDEILIGLFLYLSLAVSMIFIAAGGYFVTRCIFEIHDACKIKSPTTPDGGRSRPGPVWEVHSDWDGSEEAGGDGEEA
jgi:hypothetical protein